MFELFNLNSCKQKTSQQAARADNLCVTQLTTVPGSYHNSSLYVAHHAGIRESLSSY
jgi:hypothetical protein